MRAGELRHRVKVQSYTTTVDPSTGYREQAWADAAELWADVRHLSGTESIRAAVDTSIVKASCRIRWRTGITAAMRVIFNGLIYDIEAVLPDHKCQFVDLLLMTTGQALEDEEPPYNGGWG